MFMLVEKLHQYSFFRWQPCERAFQKIETASNVDHDFEIGRSAGETFIDRIDMLEPMAPPPVIPHLIVDDFHEQPVRVGHVTEAAERADGVKRDFLFQVFVAYRSPGSTRGSVKQCSNIGEAEIHVTVLRSVRP